MNITFKANENMVFRWEKENRTNMIVYLAPGVKEISCSGKDLYKGNIQKAETILNSATFKDRLPRFDIAVAATLDEIDQIIRPTPESALKVIIKHINLD